MTQDPVEDDRAASSGTANGRRALVLLLATYAIAGGLVTLVGWTIEAPRLTDWRNDGISMFPNPSLAAILAGIALVLPMPSGSPMGPGSPSAPGSPTRAGSIARTLARILACAVLALGGLTLLEHLTGANLGIDTLLFDRPWGQSAAASPMRMGPPASGSFLLLGASLLLRTFGGRARSASSALGVAVCSIALLSLIGHLYGARQMYTVPYVSSIAMQTASILLALALGAVASVPEREPMRTLLDHGSAGMLARRALPFILVLSIGLGWLRIVAQERGFVDTSFGTAARTFLEIVLIVGVLWGAVRRVRQHERALRRSEAEVRHQAKQLAAFLDTAAIALHRAGPDGTILWANQAELRMLGYAQDEYVGRSILDFHVDRGVIEDLLARLGRGEKIVERASRMRCKDGSVKHVLIDSSVLWDEGRFVHTQSFTRDVTDRVRADLEREEANRRKDEFMAILGHELRNPLGPIRNSAHYLALQELDDPSARQAVERIERQVAQMARLLDDLLDVSRLSRGSLGLRRSRIVLQDVVETAIDGCRHEIAERGQTLTTSLPSERIELHADGERLVQVLGNLIGNATKYTPSGGSIDVRVSQRTRDLEITVADTGNGIPAESLNRIFELFARGDHTGGREEGLGIGLTLARQLVLLHGGTIEARSEGACRGSQFVIRLPIVARPDDDGRAPPAPRAPTASRAPTARQTSDAPCRILVADDNADAVESLKLLLQAAGHDVRTAKDGESAVRVARDFQPNVALLDLGMPKVDGYEAARQIRELGWGKRIFLVALTGWGQESDKRRGREAGFDAHFVKPVAPEDLSAILARASTGSGSTSAP